MKNFLKKTFARFAKDEEGVTLVEYGIALTLAVALGTAALGTLAGNVGGIMDDASACLGDASGDGDCTP